MKSRDALTTSRRLAVAIALLASGGCDSADDPVSSGLDRAQRAGLPASAPVAVLTNPAALVDALTAAYKSRDPHRFAALLDRRFLFLLHPQAGGPDSWNASEEQRIHRRMFRPAEI